MTIYPKLEATKQSRYVFVLSIMYKITMYGDHKCTIKASIVYVLVLSPLLDFYMSRRVTLLRLCIKLDIY